MKRTTVSPFLKLIFLAAIWCPILILLASRRQPERPEPSHGSAIYLWQRDWNEDVREALECFSSGDMALMVLAGEFRGNGQSIESLPVAIDWQAMTGWESGVTLVFRIFGSAAGDYGDVRREELVERLVSSSRGCEESAKAAGAHVAGVQIDFDCPSSKLDFYALLIEDFRKSMPDATVSITALPTHLKHSGFRQLVEKVDYYVLQVHGLERPKSVDEPVHLWHPEKVGSWVSTANRIGVPFYVALPTYGYEVIYDEEGKFAALRSEQDERAWPPGYSRRIIMAHPEDVLSVIGEMEHESFRNLIGVAWFRMPVRGDEFNWPRESFEAVLAGRIPEWKVSAEARSIEPGLWEVWVSNTGEAHGARNVSFSVKWRDCTLRVYDIIGGFRIDGGTGTPGEMRIVGKAPPLGAPVPAAWLRVSSDSTKAGTIEVSEVTLR